MVFADQATEDVPSLDPGGDIARLGGPPLRRLLPQPLVWTMAVVVSDVLGQDAGKMPLAEYQYVVEALATQRADEPLGI